MKCQKDWHNLLVSDPLRQAELLFNDAAFNRANQRFAEMQLSYSDKNKASVVQNSKSP